MLATITVTTSADVVDSFGTTVTDLINFPGADVEISLREAIRAAENTLGTDTITFDAATFNGEAQDVIYVQDTLQISESVIIDGGNLDVVISGDVLQNDRLLPGTFITDIEHPSNNPFDNERVFETFGEDQSVFAFRGLTITGGRSDALDGAGIRSRDGALIIEDTTISGNISLGAGGGIHASFGNVRVFNSTISDNITERSGGGINARFGDLVIAGSTISGNTSRFGEGGGILTGPSTLDLSNSTISGNESSQGGSGIHTRSSAPTISDSTITQNENNSSFGAGVWLDNLSNSVVPVVSVENSIIAGNAANFSYSSDLFWTFSEPIDITSSIVGSNGDNSLSPAPIGFPDANGNLIGTSFEPIDPLLAELADNGGPTQTHALLSNSPAIDAGNTLSTTDQRGQFRPADQPGIPNSITGNGADIGAFEFEVLLLTVDSSNDEIDGNFTLGNLSLREAITLSNDNPAIDAIRFDPSVFDGQAEDVIRLQLGELQITDGVTIDSEGSTVVVSADASGDDIVDPVTFITDVESSESLGLLNDNNGRIFNIDTAVGDIVIFNGLTITSGNAEDGGGIWVNSASLSLLNTSVSGNRSSGSGGGVLSNQNITFTNSTISGNVAINGRGGGIAVTQGGTITLNATTVSDNLVTGVGGGGIYSFSGGVQLTDSTVSGNQSDTRGGGIFSEQGAVNLSDSTVDVNEALHAGGGIWTNLGDVTLSNSSLTDNATTNTGNPVFGTDGGGGGIFTAMGHVSVSRSTVSYNSTSADDAVGGAISATVGDVEIEYSTLGNNSTFGDNASGGALATGTGEITVSSSTLSSNSTSGDNAIGGAIATNSGTITVSFSTLDLNSTQGEGANGGALATNSGGIRTRSSTLSSNSTTGANASGGAIATSAGDITLTDSTITENSVAGVASFAGGIYIENNVSNSSFLSINNSIVAGNSALIGNDILVDTSTTLDVNFSLIGDNTGTLLTPSAVPDPNGNLIGSFTAVIDPMLAELSSNGGTTQTHALLPGSPAIDAGSSAETSDQRLAPFVRAIGGADDIGAFEFQTLNLVVSEDSDTVDGDFSSNNLSLREAIFFANANPGEDFITFSPNAFRGFVFDAIHLTQGELEITEAVNIDGADQRVVVTGDRNRDDINFSGTAITDLTSTVAARLDDNSGVFNITAPAGQAITLNGLIISGGVADEGAGIRNKAADLVINATTIAGNRALGNGGGIFNDLGSVTITGSTISSNQTVGDNTSGGGIHANDGGIELASSTVSGNQATGLSANGGGIFSSNGDITLTNVTLTDNSADADGGGIFVSDSATNPTLKMDNTIVAANTANTNADLRYNSIAVIDIRSSLIGDNSGTPLAPAELGSPDANGNLIGTNRIVIDPQLNDLADNGGLTFTHEPLPNSPVVDAGGNSTLITDQRNIPLLGRNDGGGVDIGAFELHQFFLVVDTSIDIDDGDLSAGNLSLREALVITNTNLSRDTITFDASVFDGQLSDVIRLSSGSLTISDGDLIDGSGADVVISGDAAGDDPLIAGSFITDVFASNSFDTRSDNAARIFDITAAAGETVSIQGITITGNSGTATSDDGGGIRNQDADLVLTDVAVSGNRTFFGGDGGGVYTEDGTLTLNNSTISDNLSNSEGGGIVSSGGDIVLNNSSVQRNVSDNDGGGIYSRGDLVTLNNSTVSFNSTGRFGDGGGISASSADVTLNNSVVSGNITDEFGDGAGISTSSGDVTLNGSRVSGNIGGVNSDGGGVSTNGGDVFVNLSTINGNHSGDQGGAIATGSGNLFIDRSTISGNHSVGDGGGIGTFSGEILITNSTLSANSSEARGGAIYQNFGNGTHIANSTIFDNQSDGGVGGIYIADSFFRATLTIENTILAGHTATDGSGADLSFDSDVALDIRNSIIGSNAGTSLPATAGMSDALGNLIGTSAAPIDPLLGELANNGGPTQTHELLNDSPAINAGGSTLADVGTTDQTGELRIVDGQIDIGAFESRFLLGDVNRDGIVSVLDIFPFINVLSANTFQAEADVNLDGAVTFLDINPFITLLSGQAIGGNSANLTAAFARSSRLAFIAHSSLQTVEDSSDLQTESGRSPAVQSFDQKTNRLAPGEDAYQLTSQSNSPPARFDVTRPADLFDAQPELFDDLSEFELDEVAEGLLV